MKFFQIILLKLVPLVLVIFIQSRAYSQNEVQIATVFLNSGEIVQGPVLKVVKYSYVDVLTGIKDTTTIPWDSIDDIKYSRLKIDEPDWRKNLSEKKRNSKFRDTSYYCNLSIGVPNDFGFSNYMSAGFSLLVTVGKGFNYRHHIGLRTGYEYFEWPNMSFIPVGLDYYGRFKPQGRSWYYGVSGGYAFTHFTEYRWLENSKTRGGVFFNPYIGIAGKGTPKTGWNVEFGFKSQRAKAEYDGLIVGRNSSMFARLKHDIRINRFDIRVGLRFD